MCVPVIVLYSAVFYLSLFGVVKAKGFYVLLYIESDRTLLHSHLDSETFQSFKCRLVLFWWYHNDELKIKNQYMVCDAFG